MVSRWRILRTPINAKVENIVKAIVTLHNYSQTKLSGNGNDIYCPPNFVDREGKENGGWRAEQESLPSVGRLGANVAQRFVYDIRNTLAHYFLSDEGHLGQSRTSRTIKQQLGHLVKGKVLLGHLVKGKVLLGHLVKGKVLLGHLGKEKSATRTSRKRESATRTSRESDFAS
nr:unnamed protein product [Callosobruchus analis]